MLETGFNIGAKLIELLSDIPTSTFYRKRPIVVHLVVAVDMRFDFDDDSFIFHSDLY